MDFDDMFKIIIIGDPDVGKSNILLRYTKNEFQTEENPTIGADFFSKNIKVEDTTIKLQIWDTAGQDHFRSIVKSYYKGINGAMVVYDITRKDSFNNITKWLKEIENNCTQTDLPIVIAGNKKDLEEDRQVLTEEAATFAKEKGLFFMETSAKENGDQMIQNIFENLTNEVYQIKKKAGGIGKKNLAKGTKLVFGGEAGVQGGDGGAVGGGVGGKKKKGGCS